MRKIEEDRLKLIKKGNTRFIYHLTFFTLGRNVQKGGNRGKENWGGCQV